MDSLANWNFSTTGSGTDRNPGDGNCMDSLANWNFSTTGSGTDRNPGDGNCMDQPGQLELFHYR